eukprot:TRINITY_DN293_c0_g1_i5.p1 TRINITY_DN293_c0_g1~~TRINITY_DN293_c0_g1_i5.p1  ORF type:complete len:140 (-),score=18.23 TRINITY_DN293_c0_g1_i5:392-751(-)
MFDVGEVTVNLTNLVRDGRGGHLILLTVLILLLIGERVGEVVGLTDILAIDRDEGRERYKPLSQFSNLTKKCGEGSRPLHTQDDQIRLENLIGFYFRSIEFEGEGSETSPARSVPSTTP